MVPAVGEIYRNCEIKSIAPYGAFVEIAPGREVWIFPDHPKRPGDEDPSPPYNMVRNVLDMNAHFGGFKSALLEAGKSVWVMNVVLTTGPNYHPLILDRGFVGVLYDWHFVGYCRKCSEYFN
ncbi:hypothetical protein POM88_036184 [Heracleum sosnowskyi]|uniref:Methyltransferase n=1 Tax=Heracleum sosnowskyi TaxID=360622 RepID=A0AAD8HPQ4_9APIA|nr:hypothetical protein POM88_036184 [Heracleum sosnowskyi]